MSESKKPTVSEIRAHYEGMAARDESAFYLLDLVSSMGETLGRFSSEFPVPGCGYCTITIEPDGRVTHDTSCPIPEARALVEEVKL